MSDEIERLAAACLLPSFDGYEAPEWMLRWVERGLGGVVLFARNIRDPEQVAALTASLRAGRPDLVVATDEEGGDVTRLEAASGSSYPGNLALGAVDDVELTREVAQAMAADLRAAGVTMNLAPVADVNTEADNPTIGVRAFGSDPVLVARHVRAFVEGTQRGGVLACTKHFPGHGDTHVDSHLELPVLELSKEELAAGPLVPFIAAVEAGVAAVMTGHLVAGAWDDEPATTSEIVIGRLLRRGLGFDGLVVTDALDMGAVVAAAPLPETGVRALAAGADLLCLGPSYGAEEVAALHRAIVLAVEAGRLAAERVADGARRVERASAAATGEVAPAPPHLGREAADRAIRVSGNVRIDAAPVVVEVIPEPLVVAGEAGHTFGAAVERAWPAATVVTVRGAAEPGALLAEARGRPLVLVLRDPGRQAWQRNLASALVAARSDAVVVDVGLPGWLPEGTTASISTHGAGRVNLEAAASLL
jgi:beta-N-acetylhexosaminidase